MIMSYFSKIEMSYKKVAIILEFPGEYYSIQGHYHVKPTLFHKYSIRVQERALAFFICIEECYLNG